MGIPERMMKFIHSILTELFIKVRVGNTLSPPFMQGGVHLGSLLSVTIVSVTLKEAVIPPIKCTLLLEGVGRHTHTHTHTRGGGGGTPAHLSFFAQPPLSKDLSLRVVLPFVYIFVYVLVDGLVSLRLYNYSSIFHLI